MSVASPADLARTSVSANAGATSPSNPSLSTPAAKQFVASQAPPQGTVDAGTVTPTNTPITGNATTPSGATVNTSTGSLVTSPAPAPVDPNASYKDAFNAYLTSLTPSSDVTRATKNLSDLQLQSQKDQEEALNRGDTLGFATGEAARVNRNNSFGIDAASNTLSALTGQQTATTNAQKARLDFEKSLLPDTKPVSVGGDLVNPSTGKVIYSGTKSPTDTYGTGSIGEYNFAKSQGYKGSFTDYQNEDANRKASAANGGIVKPPTQTQTTYANYAPRLETADDTISSLTGPISKLSSAAFYGEEKLPSFFQTSDIQSYNQAKSNFISSVLRQESGAAISDSERASYDAQYFPQPGDSQKVIDQKAQNRAQVISSYKNAAGPAYVAPIGTVKGSKNPTGGSAGKTSSGLEYTIIP